MTHHSSRHLAFALALVLAVPFLISADNSSNETNASFANTSLDVSGGGTAGSVPQQTSTPPDFLVTLQGVMTLAKDVIIDLGKGDFELVIEMPVTSEKPPVTEEPVIEPVTPAPEKLDWMVDMSDEVLGEPIVILKQKQPSIIKPKDLAKKHEERVKEIKEKKIKKAPKEKDLPAFTIPITTEVENAISRGTVFQTAGTNINVSKIEPPIDSYHRITQRTVFNVLYGNHLNTNTYEQYPLIIIHKMDATRSSLDGETYGRMLFTNKSFPELWALKAGPDSPYALIALDLPLKTEAIESDALINGPLSRQNYGTTGSVGVCVIDTGINYSLPRFANSYVGGIDFVNSDNDPLDDGGHGTAMADAILTVAPGAQLYVVKALDNAGFGYTSDVIKSIDWCMQQDVKVISMSFGGGAYDSWCDIDVLAQKANEAAARGFLVIAAAGNRGHGTMDTPACGSLVTSVAASTKTPEQLWISSGLTSVTDLLAPGVAVQLLRIDGGMQTVSGTSVSVAIAAGAASLVSEATGFEGQALQDQLRSTGILINESVHVPRVDVMNAINNTTNYLPLEQKGTQSTMMTYYPGVEQRSCNEYGWCAGDGDCSYMYCTATKDGTCIAMTCDGGPSTCAGVDSFYCGVTEASMCYNGVCGSGTTGSPTCSNGIDEDVNGATDTCDSTCGYQCSSGDCCVAATCQYRTDDGSPECPTCQKCSGSSSSCSSYNSGTEDSLGSNTCTTLCKKCDGAGSCVNRDKYSTDAVGNQCTGTTGCTAANACVCDGTGNCDTDNSGTCSADGNCVDNKCLSSVYQGTATATRCVQSVANCIDGGGTMRSNTYNAGADTCYGDATGGSVWLANSGRWLVRKPDTTALAVIDKYGSTGIRGTYSLSQTSFDSGWQVSSGGNTQASINSANGNLKLRSASSITTRGTPSGTGFQVKNTGGTMEAIITTAGALTLKGDFAYSLGSLA